MTDNPPNPVDSGPAEDSAQGGNAEEKALTALAGMLECRDRIRETINDLKTQKSS
ncbi:hypothetical protein [Acaryochloris marina]|uniref:Uncharacterized protein n=1 Tax=Acaryochloris marina (strain MBIC 11017) TaxID=329726 RepID=A8ZLE6_ACAM1|nr:hypothetical protein [Acaryochloris marina]ABW31973.1 hypothetical protein AM1_B0254 [Acaryochloris marina MBIC11017]